MKIIGWIMFDILDSFFWYGIYRILSKFPIDYIGVIFVCTFGFILTLLLFAFLEGIEDKK
jgi:hypothetical protein